MFACIYIPNFFLAAALRAEPELQARAVAIFEGKPSLEKIIAVNENAATLAITPGMTKAQAELCPELALRQRSPLQETSAHAALLDCAQSFSPCVEDAACDTILLDLAGTESLLGPLPEISHAIYCRAAALGLEAHIATASNPDAALIAARGFSGVTIIPAGQEAAQLGPLPIAVLFGDHLEEEDNEEQESADRLLETLARWGIRTLHALAVLPPIALSERLGQQGLYLRQLALGAVQRTLVPVEEPLIFEEAIELDHPIVLLEPLAFLLNRLLEQLCARLAARALATQELRLTLELSNLTGVEDEYENVGIPSESDGSSAVILSGADASQSEMSTQSKAWHARQTKFARNLNLPLPMLDAKIFLKLLQLDLNANPPGAPITKIHLAAEPARPRAGQAGLFVPPTPEPEKLELTLARIASLVGEQKVGAIEMLDTHQSEGFRMRRFVAELTRKSSREQKSDLASSPPPEEASPVTALRRFRPPLRANVALENDQPVHLISRKKEVQGRVLWKAGPWRFSGDWWERDAWSRDEWDIALQSDAAKNGAIALYRLVHDLLGGGWFVEGTYD
ncbi:MAG TPA: DNA polymerase Y family protein [Candidatus Solibacter sp.]|nr:DNA polymerase Y family protein [Candidatus Solibacter sp.]